MPWDAGTAFSWQQLWGCARGPWPGTDPGQPHPCRENKENFCAGNKRAQPAPGHLDESRIPVPAVTWAGFGAAGGTAPAQSPSGLLECPFPCLPVQLPCSPSSPGRVLSSHLFPAPCRKGSVSRWKPGLFLGERRNEDVGLGNE